MRASSDIPRRFSLGSRRVRWAIVVGVVILIALIVSAQHIASLYTDFLWFQSLGFSSVWAKTITVEAGSGGHFQRRVLRSSLGQPPAGRPVGPGHSPAPAGDELVTRWQELAAPHMKWIRLGVAALLALIGGISAHSQWDNWLLFSNAGAVHVDVGALERGRPSQPPERRVLRIPPTFLGLAGRLGVLGSGCHAAAVPGGPLPQRRDPASFRRSTGKPSRQGAHIGSAGRPGAGARGELLPRAPVPGAVYEVRGGRGHLHRRPRRPARSAAPHRDIRHRRRLVPLQRAPAGLAAAGRRGRLVGPGLGVW